MRLHHVHQPYFHATSSHCGPPTSSLHSTDDGRQTGWSPYSTIRDVTVPPSRAGTAPAGPATATPTTSALRNRGIAPEPHATDATPPRTTFTSTPCHPSPPQPTSPTHSTTAESRRVRRSVLKVATMRNSHRSGPLHCSSPSSPADQPLHQSSHIFLPLFFHFIISNLLHVFNFQLF